MATKNYQRCKVPGPFCNICLRNMDFKSVGLVCDECIEFLKNPRYQPIYCANCNFNIVNLFDLKRNVLVYRRDKIENSDYCYHCNNKLIIGRLTNSEK